MNHQDLPGSAAKSLPRVKELLVPVFRYFVQHRLVSSEHCAASMTDLFKLCEDQRTDCGVGNELRLNKSIEFIFNILSQKSAKLIEHSGSGGSRNRYQITERGQTLAEEGEESIERELKGYYRAYYTRHPYGRN